MGLGGVGAQYVHITDEDATTVEIDQIFLTQLVQNEGDRLAAGAGDVGNVLMRQAVLKQHFVTDAAAALGNDLVQEVDDATASILKDEVL